MTSALAQVRRTFAHIGLQLSTLPVQQQHLNALTRISFSSSGLRLAPIRRARKRNSRYVAKSDGTNDAKKNEQNTDTIDRSLNSSEDQIVKMIGLSKPFVAKNADGEDLTMDEYLKFATLSPWVPVPEIVAKKVLEVANVNSSDVRKRHIYSL